MTRVTFRLLGLLMAVMFGPFITLQATSHDNHSDWYRTKWKADHHTGLSITWRFAPSFPNDQGKRDRVKNAFGRWNGLGQDMKFDQLAEASDFQPFSCDDHDALTYNGISWAGLDGQGGTIAHTKVCWHATDTTYHTSHQFLIRFDDQEDWYGGDASPPNDMYDLEGVATHEVGHATGGWLTQSVGGHWSAGLDLCTQSPKHTMCPTILKGDNHWETLETHDRHTFTGLYPP